MHKTLKLTFLSDWHVSAGVGDGFLADSVLIRDNDGFPFVSGRAMKGALRDASRRVGLCREDLHKAEVFFFGNNDQSLSTRDPGLVRISSAQVSPLLKAQLNGCANKEELIADLTLLRKQTALNDAGTAQTNSLRAIECGIQGIELFASLEVEPCPQIEEAWLEQYFAAVCAAVKNVGGNCSRGMGRCHLVIEGYKAQIKLPTNNTYLASLGGRA
ncbi:MAG: hypothetical protein IJU40_01650 [Desulfovibrionaceae bacterium]|nr:hypothetical protein [Desulfovibrionaceae bacterium]